MDKILFKVTATSVGFGGRGTGRDEGEGRGGGEEKGIRGIGGHGWRV